MTTFRLFHGFFKEFEWAVIVSLKKVLFGQISGNLVKYSGLKKSKSDQKCAQPMHAWYMLWLIMQ